MDDLIFFITVCDCGIREQYYKINRIGQQP